MADDRKPPPRPTSGPMTGLARCDRRGQRRARRKEQGSMNGTVDTGAEDTMVDHTVTAVASGVSRRAVVRSLAAGLLAVASGGIATDAPAKKRRKRKSKTCPQGTLFAEVSVLADGSQAFTPVLKEGQV